MFSPRPTTLWPFADAEPLPGTARLAGWLGQTIVTLVTRYTRPADRVLLLTPPTPPSGLSPASGRARGTDPYAGLAEVVWTVIRLGRSADSATAAPVPDYPHDPAGPIAKSGSGPRPRLPDTCEPADSGSANEPHPRPTSRPTHRPDGRFNLILTAVHPYATDWLAHTEWDPLLAATGTLAVVTHSDAQNGRLVDPIPAIVSTVRSQRRGWIDHIAVLTEPLPSAPSGATAARPSPTTPRPVTGVPGARSIEPLPLRRVHHDLLLFGPVPAGPATEHRENLG